MFDLTGPNGYTAFSGLTTSTTPLILPADGTYTLTVRTVGLPGGYAFQLQQSSVIPLTVNLPYQGILSASDQAQLFSFTLSGNESSTLVELTDPNVKDHNEVYVGFGFAPTRDNYTYRSTSLSAANQQVGFSSSPGTYYVLVYNSLVAAPGTYTLNVQSEPFIPTGISPGRIGNGFDSSLLISGVFPVSLSRGGLLTDGFGLKIPGFLDGDGLFSPPPAQMTFNAVAGQPLRFDLEYTYAGVRFDLTRPNGFTAFQGAVSSSEWFTAPSTGIYTVTAHSFLPDSVVVWFQVEGQATPFLGTNPTVQFIAADGTLYPAAPMPLSLISDPTYLANHDLSGGRSGDGTVITALKIPAHTLPAGTYSVRITDDSGYSQTLDTPLNVVDGGIGVLQTNVIVPNPIGNHIPATIYVQYQNVGDAPLAAPLLVLSASRPKGTDAFLTLDPNLRTSGFWTSAIPDRHSSTVQILASGSLPGILQPGELVTVPVYYAGWLVSEWDSGPITFNLGSLTDDNILPLDWDSLKSSIKPATLSQDAGDALYPNLTAQLGSTWGDYVKKLDADAQYLHGLGENVTGISQLFAFEVEKAAGYSPLSSLAGATDAAVAAPGLGLGLGRTFQPSLISRNQFGRFGWGWSDSWDTHLTVDLDGSVNIFGPGGSLRRFQPDLRAGYFAQAGDHGTLAAISGGGYTLTELDGQVTDYNADGTLNYVEDTNGNRITASYVNGVLTRLSHSSGQFLSLAPNALADLKC